MTENVAPIIWLAAFIAFIAFGAYKANEWLADALNAMQGAGTCRNESPDRNSFKCSECGGAWYGVGDIARSYPKYCPNCGRRIVEVDE